MRTFLYVDGFNLFHGCLKRSRPGYRWLDLNALATKVLSPKHRIDSIHYCTALVKPDSETDPTPGRQRLYINALKAFIPHLSVQYGHFTSHPSSARHLDPPPDIVRYQKVEEKGSDVNLAARLVADAFQDRFDCAVILSNDGDMAPAARIARKEAEKRVGVIAPVQHVNGGQARRVSNELSRNADFVRTIRRSAIAKSQLPSPIPGTSYFKPKHW